MYATMVSTLNENPAMRLFSVYIIVCVCISAMPLQAAHAGSSIDTINSIALVNTFATPPVDIGDMRATVFGITFSLQTFDRGVTLFTKGGLATMRDAAARIGADTPFDITSKWGSRHTDPNTHGLIAWSYVYDGTHSDTYTVPRNSSSTVTFLVAFADYPDPDRSDRVEMTGMKLLFEEVPAAIHLNPSEVGDLKSARVELY